MPDGGDESRWLGPRRWMAAIVGTGGALFVFDILRKTLFLGANWNYAYPPRRLVYSLPVTLVLFGLGIGLVVVLRQSLQICQRYFIGLLYVSAILLSFLAVIAMPLRTKQFLNPAQEGIYRAGVIAVERGPIEYFDTFHTIGPESGDKPHADAAQTAASVLFALDFVPWNEQMAEYARTIPEQKHGPLPILLMSPFLYLHSIGLKAAMFGRYLFTAILPVVGYFVYRVYFSEQISRIGALFILFAPAFHIYQRGIVPYDLITGIFLAGSLYYFVRSLKYDSLWTLGWSGLLFSFSFLSKISAFTIILAYLPLLFLYSNKLYEFGKKLGVFTLSSLLVPTGLLVVGYNFVIQYLFTLARLLNSDPAQGAGSYLQNPLLGYLGPMYNVRLMGPAVLLPAVLFLGFTGYYVLNTYQISDDTQMVGVCLAIPPIPFLFLLLAPQLSRHLLPMLVPVGFLGVLGLKLIGSWEECIRLVQVALIVNMLVLIASL